MWKLSRPEFSSFLKEVTNNFNSQLVVSFKSFFFRHVSLYPSTLPRISYSLSKSSWTHPWNLSLFLLLQLEVPIVLFKYYLVLEILMKNQRLWTATQLIWTVLSNLLLLALYIIITKTTLTTQFVQQTCLVIAFNHVVKQ